MERDARVYVCVERVNVSSPLFPLSRRDRVSRHTRDIIEFFHEPRTVSWKKVENGVLVPLLKTVPDDSCQSRYTRLYVSV